MQLWLTVATVRREMMTTTRVWKPSDTDGEDEDVDVDGDGDVDDVSGGKDVASYESVFAPDFCRRLISSIRYNIYTSHLIN